MSNGFESFLIPKIYEYAKLEESKTIKKLREEIAEYVHTLKALKYDYMHSMENDFLYSLCDKCYHFKNSCFRCFKTFSTCKWCQEGIKEKCEYCE